MHSGEESSNEKENIFIYFSENRDNNEITIKNDENRFMESEATGEHAGKLIDVIFPINLSFFNFCSIESITCSILIEIRVFMEMNGTYKTTIFHKIQVLVRFWILNFNKIFFVAMRFECKLLHFVAVDFPFAEKWFQFTNLFLVNLNHNCFKSFRWMSTTNFHSNKFQFPSSLNRNGTFHSWFGVAQFFTHKLTIHVQNTLKFSTCMLCLNRKINLNFYFRRSRS